jgi:hypothetical protein
MKMLGNVSFVGAKKNVYKLWWRSQKERASYEKLSYVLEKYMYRNAS